MKRGGATAEPPGSDAPAGIADVAREVCAELARGHAVRKSVPPVGSLAIEGHVPFLAVYRSPRDRADAGTKELVTSEAAYLFAAGDAEHAAGLQEFCRLLAEHQRATHGAFVLVEIWSAELGGHSPGETRLPQGAFRLTHDGSLESTVAVLRRHLGKLRFGDEEEIKVSVSISPDPIAPPGLPALLVAGEGLYVLGIEVHPFWRDEETLYPALLRNFRVQFSAALRRALFDFATGRTDPPPRHHHELGARGLVKVTHQFDRRLAAVSDAFDFLLQVTPINFEAARDQFARSHCERAPTLHYRPLGHQPEELKRQLFEIPLARLEDPTVAFLLGEKQAELDRQLTALGDIGTPNFLYTCLQLYGAPDAALVRLAEEILEHTPATARNPDRPFLATEEVCQRARAHIAHYRRRARRFNPAVEIRGDIASGMLVSRGALYISEHHRPSSQRLDALLHHEIGTHLVTHFNGAAQPFLQLRSGLAGYEPLQEGLAVLAECLVGGLNAGRVRTLAGRVLASRWLVDGAGFVDVYRRLAADIGFSPAQATRITMRVFRGGGFVKDQIYLRGLRDLVAHLAEGHPLEPLYAGKIALTHVPYLQELRHRRIIRAPRLLPQFLEDESARARLARVRQSTVLALLTSPIDPP